MAAKISVFATLGNSFKESFLELYNSLGFTLLTSFLWFAGNFPILIFINLFLVAKSKSSTIQDLVSYIIMALLLFLIWNSFVAGPLVAVTYGLYQERKEDYPNLNMFLRIIKKVYWRSVLVYGAFSLSVSLLILNIVFAIVGKQIFLMVVAAISIYTLFFITLMSFYFNPLLVLDNSFKKVIRKSFLLVMDNFWLSFCSILILGLLLGLSIKVVFLFVLMYGAIMIYFTNRVFTAVYDRYES